MRRATHQTQQEKELIQSVNASFAPEAVERASSAQLIHADAALRSVGKVTTQRTFYMHTSQRTQGNTSANAAYQLPTTVDNLAAVTLEAQIPFQALRNVNGYNNQVPLGVPFHVPLSVAPLGAFLPLTFEVRTVYKVLPDAAVPILQRLLAGIERQRRQGSIDLSEPLEELQVAIREALVPAGLFTTTLRLPPKLNPLRSVAPGLVYTTFVTVEPHGLLLAQIAYRQLKLGVRFAGSLLLRGVPELLPSLNALSHAGFTVDGSAQPLIVVDDMTTFRVRNDLLLLYYARADPSWPDPATDPLAAIQKAFATTGNQTIYLSADMPVVTELMEILNTGLVRLANIEEPLNDDPALMLPLVPDELTFLATVPGSGRVTPRSALQSGVWLQWEVNRNPLSQLALMRHLNDLPNIPTSAVDRHVGFVELTGGTLARFLGLPLGAPLSDAGMTSASSASSLQSMSERMQQIEMPVFLQRQVAPGSLSSVRRFRCIGCSFSNSPLVTTVTVRTGRYPDAKSLSDATSLACAGLTFHADEPRTIVITDGSGMQEMTNICVPIGTFTTESFRRWFEHALRTATSNETFYVDYMTSVPAPFQAPHEWLTASGRGSLEEGLRVADDIGSWPRYVTWIVGSTTSTPFGLIFSSAVLGKKLGFYRNDLVGQSIYRSSEAAFEPGLPFDLGATPVDDDEGVSRIRMGAVAGGNACLRHLTSTVPANILPGPTPSTLRVAWSTAPFAPPARPCTCGQAQLQMQRLRERLHAPPEPVSLARLQHGDVMVGRASPNLVYTLVAAAPGGGRGPAQDMINGHQYNRFYQTPSAAALSLPSTYWTQLQNDSRFCLLFGLFPAQSLWRLFGFPANIVPFAPDNLVQTLLPFTMNMGSTATPRITPNMERLQMFAYGGAEMGTGSQGSLLTDLGRLDTDPVSDLFTVPSTMGLGAFNMPESNGPVMGVVSTEDNVDANQAALNALQSVRRAMMGAQDVRLWVENADAPDTIPASPSPTLLSALTAGEMWVRHAVSVGGGFLQNSAGAALSSAAVESLSPFQFDPQGPVFMHLYMIGTVDMQRSGGAFVEHVQVVGRHSGTVRFDVGASMRQFALRFTDGAHDVDLGGAEFLFVVQTTSVPSGGVGGRLRMSAVPL
jgi:hypothetical protein